MKVEIVRVKSANADDTTGTVAVEVIVDGAWLGGGSFGGEPKDNYEFRGYSWVIPLLKKIALAMGGTVEETEKEVDY